ncbi:hypothetical protein MLD38_001472 [Melastoma candidum]|uniref:Uncharacterized protein n=1 Tax=Melastoma candidum TaxID=119954 RepID=A0ACB9SHB0_9MYRT|nr:hypothetical protein MLD38_001472 [Melastoma candidum]
MFKDEKQPLNLISKEKVVPGVRSGGLKASLAPGNGGRSKIDGWSDGSLCLGDSRDLTSNSPSDSSTSGNQNISSLDVSLTSSSPNSFQPESRMYIGRVHAASEYPNMQPKGSGSDAFRVSVSSAPSTSSHGSVTDDCDAMGDVYIWGEVLSDGVIKVDATKNASYMSMRTDVLLPRPLECSVVLDVSQIACGVHHAALITKQGELFSWGEESGGRLGHGSGKNVVQPRLVESLAFSSVDFVACGEFHSCAVTSSGELFTWGDGTHNVGLLGHGTNVSHWIPKRISGTLEGLQVASVSCGPWHTALITTLGQLFTFGDGTFGALGHGDRENVMYPKEVESLVGLRTIAVACGVWHTAAVVEVIVTQSSSVASSGKLFTWGDGDKNRLGHGDKEARLKPTCVPALIEHNFMKIACGHSITAGLTTSGQVFTMGSTVYGQLGNPLSEGKLPSLVNDKLGNETVEEIACGSYHVAVLTAKNEVYTWGKGANGRLGHGDLEDRKVPTLVEALKDRHVKFIACGSNYTAAVCIHKWVSGAEQSQCAACRQAFGFTRKRHNCYNCGLVHCHSCSSRKVTRAALAPSPSKPYRVCDSCYVKLNKVLEARINSRRNAMPRLSAENKERFDKSDMRLRKASLPTNMELIKQLDHKAAKQGKADTFSLIRSSQAPSFLQLREAVLSTAIDLRHATPKPISIQSGASSRSVSPFMRRLSPPRSATPVPTTSGLSFSKSIGDGLKKTNELLNQEVVKLRAQVDSLRQRCEHQELELQRCTKRAQEAIELAAEESAKSQAAKEVIKSLTAQLKDMAERLPPGAYDAGILASTYLPNGFESNGVHFPDRNGESHSRSSSIASLLATSAGVNAAEASTNRLNWAPETSERARDNGNARLPVSEEGDHNSNDRGTQLTGSRESRPLQDGENGSRSSGVSANPNQAEPDWIEQYEPGVYITLVALPDGTRDLKRVRFSRRRFGEHQAETWWSENRGKVYQRYNVRSSDRSSASGQAARRSEGAPSVVSDTR